MKTIRKLARNGNATTLSIHPAMLDFLRWRAGDFLVVEVRSREELVVRVPQPTDMRAPMEVSTIDVRLPVEAKP